MGKEKRRSPRYTLNQLVNIEYGREDYVYGDAVDISETGIGVLCDSAIAPSSRMFIMFQLGESGGHTVRCEGFVTRSEKTSAGRYHVGVDFAEMIDSDRNAIVEFLASR